MLCDRFKERQARLRRCPIWIKKMNDDVEFTNRTNMYCFNSPEKDAEVAYQRTKFRIDQYANTIKEPFLEEISLHTITKCAESQTENFFERPPTPVFVPFYNGVDVGLDSLNLMDFDAEVNLILEKLIGIIITQSLLETEQEEELFYTRQQIAIYEETRQVELHEARRLKERARRIDLEKKNRLKQAAKLKEIADVTQRRILARRTAHDVIDDAMKSIYNELTLEDFLMTNPENDIQEKFYEPLLSKILSNLHKRKVATQLLDSMIIRSIYMRNTEFLTLERCILIERVVKDVLPLLLKDCAEYALKTSVNRISKRYASAFSALDEVSIKKSNEIYESVSKNLAIELLAQKEAETAAENIDERYG